MEHFGLGRYGDPIEPDAWEKALKSFQRVLKQNGRLYLSVPVGKANKLCFNAHRVYNPHTIINILDSMQVLEMGYISGFDVINCMKFEDNKLRIYEDRLASMKEGINVGPTGLFEFIKK